MHFKPRKQITNLNVKPWALWHKGHQDHERQHEGHVEGRQGLPVEAHARAEGGDDAEAAHDLDQAAQQSPHVGGGDLGDVDGHHGEV